MKFKSLTLVLSLILVISVFSIVAVSAQSNSCDTIWCKIGSLFSGSITGNTILTAPQQANCPQGMVGYWNFDEGSGSNVYDAFNIFNGVSPRTDIWVPGKVGSYAFNNSLDKSKTVVIPHNAALSPTTAMTIELWYYARGGGADDWSRAIAKDEYGATGRGYFLTFFGLNNPANARASWNFMGSGVGGIEAAPGSTVLNKWSHLVATYNGSVLRIYIDGNLSNSRSTAGLINVGSSTDLRIGGTTSGNDQGFNGMLDEVAIYNRSISGPSTNCNNDPNNEVCWHYKNGLGMMYCSGANVGEPCSSSVDCNMGATCWSTSRGTYVCQSSIGNSNFSANLLVYAPDKSSCKECWTGDFEMLPCGQSETAGIISYWRAEGNTNDALGINNGVANGGLTYTTGKVGDYAFNFNTTTSMYATSTNFPGGNSPRTVAYWVNYKQQGGNIIHYGTTDGNPAFYNQYWGLGGSCEGVLGWGNDWCSEFTASLNTWTFIVYTFDGSSIKLYANGVLKHADPQFYKTNSSAPFVVGEYSNVTIDEIAVFNRALNSTEISTLYSKSISGKAYCQPGGVSIPAAVQNACVPQWSPANQYCYQVTKWGQACAIDKPCTDGYYCTSANNFIKPILS